MNDAPHVELRGRGPDLVLLHGWALHGGAWGPWLDRLAEHARLHLVDLPGHGRSPWPAGATGLAGLARSVLPCVPRGAAVLGWSLGGMVALELAHRHPQHLRALVLVATTPRFLAGTDWPHGLRAEVLEGFARGLEGDYRRTLQSFLTLQTRGDEHAAQALRALRSSLAAHGEPDARALAAGLRILREADLREVLPRIVPPALVIAGGRDRLTSPHAGRALAAALPAARFCLIEHAGHAPFLAHADAVLKEVLPFLAGSVGEPAPAPSRARARPGSATIAADAAIAALRPERQEVQRSFDRAAWRYDAAAVLQSTVRGELLERLGLVRLAPAVVLDIGAGTGQATVELKRRYPRSRVIAADLAEGMLREARRRQTWLRRFERIGADAAALPLREASVDLIFSNLMLQWCADPDAVFRECRRVLRPGGLLTFTTFGPDTLVELRRAWASADPGRPHVNPFLDMHDLGDALLRAGLAEPVMDVERFTLTYAEVRALMHDLKAIGAHNASVGRARGLTGKRTLARMTAAYEQFRRAADGRLPATYEVVFGQAWGPVGAAPSKARVDGEVRVPVASLGRRARPG